MIVAATDGHTVSERFTDQFMKWLKENIRQVNWSSKKISLFGSGKLSCDFLLGEFSSMTSALPE
jgi:hypothetical protein